MPDITMKRVESSQIHSIGFDGQNTVRIRFHDRTRKNGTVVPGATYEYTDCAPEDHDHLVGADSIGSHFAKHFRNRECRRVE